MCIRDRSLSLLGSANLQFSAIRRKKILVAINKDKIGPADQPLPNAKRLLFGEDFPSIVSKQADLSRGLAKNLGAASRPAKRPRLGTAHCNRLHSRSTKPPTGESCEGEIPLLEGKGDSNYVRSSISKCTRHSKVMSPSNLASSPSFSILANQID